MLFANYTRNPEGNIDYAKELILLSILENLKLQGEENAFRLY
jgi:hypothetical protein